jgi:hypothetical protein
VREGGKRESVECVSSVCRVCVECVSSVCRVCVECVSSMCRVCVKCVSRVCVECVSSVCRVCVECVSSVCQRGKRTLAIKQVLVRGETELDVVDDLFSKKKGQCPSVLYPV